MAVPILNIVEPSSIAISKSFVIPIDNSFNPKPRAFNLIFNSRKKEKLFRISVSLSVNGAIVIKPTKSRCSAFLQNEAMFNISSSFVKPNFVASSYVLISKRIFCSLFILPACFSISSANFNESTE